MGKNPAAVALGRARWKGVSKKDRVEVSKSINAARMVALSPEQRSAIAKKAAAARWGKKEGASK